MKILLRTSAIILLTTLALLTYARREDSGWIVFEQTDDGLPALFLMNGDGSFRHEITPRGVCGTSPRLTPNGKWIGFTNPCSESLNLFVINVGGSILRTYAEPELTIRDYAWSSDGDLAYLSGCICQNQIALTIQEAAGDNRQITSGYSAVYWPPHSDWIYGVPNSVMESSLDRIHAQSGHTEKLLPGGTLNVHPGWSSDARQMVVALSTDSGDELFIMSADGESLNQISSDLPLPRLRMPRWSPDGEWIAFWGGQPSEWKLWRVRSDGGDLQPLSQPIESLTNLQWSPNGKWLLFSADHDRQPTIFRLRADGSSMENLGLGENPQFAPIAGLRWRPFWLMTVALGMFLVTLVSRRGFETRFYAGKRL